MVAIAVVLGIVGAKLWHVIDTPAEFREEGWRVLWDTAGFAWFGGLLFGISALVFQGWWAKIGGLRTLDLAAPSAAIGYGIGRIGCFLSGDGCYGLADKARLALGHEFSRTVSTDPAGVPRLSDTAAGAGCRVADRLVAVASGWKASCHGHDSRPVSGAQWNSSLSG